MNKKIDSIKSGLFKRISNAGKKAAYYEELLEDFRVADPKYLKGFIEDKLGVSEGEYDDAHKEIFKCIDRMESSGEEALAGHLAMELMFATLGNKTFLKEYIKYIKEIQEKEKEA